MAESKHLYSLSYRQEVLTRFFDYVKSGESFYVVGAPSVGKTRLLDFLMGDNLDAVRAGSESDRHQVKKHYLGIELSNRIWLVRVDMNRISREENWSFHLYELMLSALLFDCSKYEQTDELREIQLELASLDSDAIESKDALKVQRFLEMAISRLCQVYGIKLCFLFDEFDETYRKMPRDIFAQLRAIRDANKYRLSYALFMRNLPDRLRNPADNESFYELISRNMVGLGPYTQEDSMRIIEQIEERKGYALSLGQREWLYKISGGHPGLLQALFDILKEKPHAVEKISDLVWCANQESVREEFRKIFEGLLADEKAVLLAFAKGNLDDIPHPTGKLLFTKGLLKQTGNTNEYFSPLLKLYLQDQ